MRSGEQLLLSVEGHCSTVYCVMFYVSAYTWSDGSVVLYFYWNRNEPDMSDPPKDCIVMDDRAKWTSLQCNAHREFICQIEKGKHLLHHYHQQHF